MKITISLDTKNTVEVREAIDFLRIYVPVEAKEAHSVTDTAQKPKVKKNPTQDKGSAKKEPEEAPTQEVTSSITLDVLKDSAKKAVTRTDRVKVKDTIGEFATKLSEVKPEDYGRLYKKLQELK